MRKIGIIGGGPAGVFAALNIKNEKNEVYLIEKNKDIGEKLKITGNGRCNITNAKPYNEFLDNIIRNKNFMYSSFSRFDNYSMIDYLKQNGMETVVEDNMKVFPKSMKSSDVIILFKSLLDEKGVNFIGNCRVDSVEKTYKFVVKTDRQIYKFDYVIIATGGVTYPVTGSNGDGYKFAQKFNHNIIKQVPSIAPLYIEDKVNIRALNLEGVGLGVKTDKETYFSNGNLLITRNFLTGPLALNIQARACRDRIEKIWIDLFPDKTTKDLEEEFVKLLTNNSKKNISNILKEIINESLVAYILDMGNISKDKKANQITRNERNLLVNKLKELTFTYKENINFNNAVVTSGGVDVKEVNPKTMESKLVEGLFFIGEILDVDGLTGGFNLQIAFTSAYAASLGIKEKI